MPIDIQANYIRIKVKNHPANSKFRVKDIGGGIKALIAIIGGKSEIQSFLFPKSKFTLSKARAWINEHKYNISETVCYLTNIGLVGPDYIEFEETLITPEIELELNKEEPINVLQMKKETWSWLLE